MKRIYACILIVAALLGVSLYSSGRVQGFAQDISADLDCALEAVRQKDFPTARQALAEGAELCDTMRETMSHLLRTADYTELEAALRAADGYLEQQATGGGGAAGMACPAAGVSGANYISRLSRPASRDKRFFTTKTDRETPKSISRS